MSVVDVDMTIDHLETKRSHYLDIKNFENAISFAKEKENGAIHFYESAKQMTENPSSQVMFQEMADEERRHFKFLDEIKADDIASFPIEKVPDLKISQYTEDIPFSSDLSYQQILIVAMKKEEEAHKLYSDIADMTTDPRMAKLFRVLAQEEAKHKLKLESEYEDHVLKSW